MSGSMFSTSTSFCGRCGSILPLLREHGDVRCYSCPAEYTYHSFKNINFKYTVNFNAITATTADNPEEDEAEGPVVERKCPKCGNEKMSYATLQLRSADEGQTVFYTCTSCKFKETENS